MYKHYECILADF